MIILARGFRTIGGSISLALIVLSGCRGITPPVEFYTLNPVLETQAAAPAAELNQSIAIGVGPIEFPKALDRPQIVTRSSANKLNVSEFHRWAGSLVEDFLRVLAANLSVLMKSNRVAAYPWEDYFIPNYHIGLDVHRFDGNLAEAAVLDVTWTITGKDGRNTLLVRKSVIRESVLEADYEGFVAAKSRAIATLSREISAAIKALRPGDE